MKKSEIKEIIDDIKTDIDINEQNQSELHDSLSNSKFQTLKNILGDINADIEINKQRQDEFSRNYVRPKYEIKLPCSHRGRGENLGIMPIVFPQICGLVLGFALARLFHGNTCIYIILGLITALAVGTWKSVFFDKIEFKYAVIRNIIIMLTPFTVMLVFLAFYGILYIIG